MNRVLISRGRKSTANGFVSSADETRGINILLRGVEIVTEASQQKSVCYRLPLEGGSGGGGERVAGPGPVATSACQPSGNAARSH